jgi:hypothetical protein
MKKIFSYFLCVVFVLLLTECNNTDNEELVGIWKVESLSINDTNLPGGGLENWLWEFNEEGGYMINAEGGTEKGTYKKENNSLTLHPVSNAERPDLTYTISHLDSANLKLSSITDKSKMLISFVKVAAGEMGEKD